MCRFGAGAAERELPVLIFVLLAEGESCGEGFPARQLPRRLRRALVGYPLDHVEHPDHIRRMLPLLERRRPRPRDNSLVLSLALAAARTRRGRRRDCGGGRGGAGGGERFGLLLDLVLGVDRIQLLDVALALQVASPRLPHGGQAAVLRRPWDRLQDHVLGDLIVLALGLPPDCLDLAEHELAERRVLADLCVVDDAPFRFPAPLLHEARGGDDDGNHHGLVTVGNQADLVDALGLLIHALLQILHRHPHAPPSDVELNHVLAAVNYPQNPLLSFALREAEQAVRVILLVVRRVVLQLADIASAVPAVDPCALRLPRVSPVLLRVAVVLHSNHDLPPRSDLPEGAREARDQLGEADQLLPLEAGKPLRLDLVA
mmetsp:Transcript_846/g.1883  ORF Transcript_846/g.1883 Transcript_846/m.1883 type:complete len:373 (+) Transcript_846:1645-2763(+)